MLVLLAGSLWGEMDCSTCVEYNKLDFQKAHSPPWALLGGLGVQCAHGEMVVVSGVLACFDRTCISAGRGRPLMCRLGYTSCWATAAASSLYR